MRSEDEDDEDEYDEENEEDEVGVPALSFGFSAVPHMRVDEDTNGRMSFAQMV